MIITASSSAPHPSPAPSLSPFPASPSSRPPPPPFSGPLECIFFAEFDTIVGPALTCQSPPTFLTPAIFDLISPFIITAPELTHKLITLTLSLPSTTLTILSYPVALDHPKYPRNSLLFNVAFAFTGRASPSHRPYHPVLRKLASYIETLEVESEFLFRPETKARLPALIASIWQQLSQYGQCEVLANPANRIYLRLYPQLPRPPALRAWDVPVLLRPLGVGEGQAGGGWDLTFRALIPFIDSASTLSLIAHRSTVPLPHVRRCVELLMAHQAVTVVDPFQWSNGYAPGVGLGVLYKGEAMRREGAEYVGGVTGAELMRLYGGMRRGEDVEGFMRREGLHLRPEVDVRRLVVFGMMHQLIRRVQVFPIVERGGLSGQHSADEVKEKRAWEEESKRPIYEDDEEDDDADSESGSDEDTGEGESEDEDGKRREEEVLLGQLLPLCDGHHCSDELCYRFALSYRELHRVLSTDLRVVFIHR